MIRFTCDQCGAAFEVADEMAGKQGKCTQCGAVLSIPAAEIPPAPTPSPAPLPRPGSRQAAPPSPPAAVRAPAAGAAVAADAPTGGAGGMAITALVLGILGLLLAAVCVGVLPALVGLILGIVALVKAGKVGRPKGVAITGTALSGAALAISVVIAPIMVAILVPVIGSALKDANRSGCQANLKTLGSAVLEYRRAQDGTVPQTLKVLVDEGYMPMTGFKCPADKNWEYGRTSYFYHPPKDAYSGSPNRIIACDFKDYHGDGRSYLTLAGNVAFMELEGEDFYDRLSSDPGNRAFAAALQAAEASGAKYLTVSESADR